MKAKAERDPMILDLKVEKIVKVTMMNLREVEKDHTKVIREAVEVDLIDQENHRIEREVEVLVKIVENF